MLASTLKQVRSININTAINYVAVFYAFSLPISRAGISLGTALLFLLWLIEGNFKDKFRFLIKNKVIIALFAFVTFSALSLLWSSDHVIGLNNLRKYWYFLPILVFATSIKKEYFFRILSAFLFGMLISEIISYGIFFEWWNFKNIPPDNPSPFMHHIDYSMFLAMTSLLLLNRFFFEASVKLRIFYFFYFLTVTANLFLNGGRTGQLAFAITIFIVGFINIKNKLLAFVSMLILVVAIFFVAYNISPVFKTRFDQGANEVNKISSDTKDQFQGSFGMRLAVWKEAMKIVPEHPLLGVGTGDEMHVIEDQIKKNQYDESYIRVLHTMIKFNYHNTYVQFIVQLGIVGLFLYLLIFYRIIQLKIKDTGLSNLRYIFVSVFMLSSMFNQMFSVQFSLAFFAFFIGIFIAVSQVEEEEFFIKY